MLDKLEEINSRFEKLTDELGKPEVVRDQNRYRKLTQEHSGLQEIVESYQLYLKIQQQLEGNRELSEDKGEDPEIRKMAVQEIHELNIQIQKIQKQIELLLLPKDPDDSRNIIIEIRAGTGGDEAALFARDLFQMYAHYSESQKWRLKLMNESRNDLGGFKEITFSIEGKEVYSRLKYEGGVHRVQRVPKTETQGRIHTSACTVAVLPKQEEIDSIDINPSDLRIDTFRASGAGGQHVNKTDSAIRITHLPTGVVVECQDERSQHKNKARAMSLLSARLLDAEQTKQRTERAEQRKSLVGSGDRSERIRTYNFPERRVTDHRIGLTLYKLDEIFQSDFLATSNLKDTSSELVKKIIFARIDEILNLSFKIIKVYENLDDINRLKVVLIGDGSKILDSNSIHIKEIVPLFEEIDFFAALAIIKALLPSSNSASGLKLYLTNLEKLSSLYLFKKDFE